MLIHWREYLISETQDKMAETFNFFQVDEEEYKNDSFHKYLKRLDFVMNNQMREFARNSTNEFVKFVRSFT